MIYDELKKHLTRSCCNQLGSSFYDKVHHNICLVGFNETARKTCSVIVRLPTL